MGKKSHKKTQKNQFLTANKVDEKAIGSEVETENQGIEKQVSKLKVRSSAEIEEQDNVVHDDDSPKDPKKFILASESEDDSTKFQEITNTIEETDDLVHINQSQDQALKIIPKEQTKLSPAKPMTHEDQICLSNDQNLNKQLRNTDEIEEIQKKQLPGSEMETKFDSNNLDLIKGQREEAIPLIMWDTESQKFVVNEEAKNVVRQISGPIGVIAVAGMYRTGKSYLLNRVLLNLEQNKGFGVGPTINPCTKGLWIWAKPIIGYSEDGQQVNVIVVDSEGIGGLDEDNNHDSRIFSLALLLSSFFLYNSMGSIDENALSSLSFVTNLSELIKSKSTQQSGEDKDLVQHMPKFMWVVRDFSLQLVNDNGIEITSTQYLEKALQNVKAEKGDQRNEIKQSLRKYFTQRDCFTLVRPIVDENNLQSLNSVKIEDLRPEFLEQIFALRSQVLDKMAFKKINGQKIDGIMWISLAEQYIDQINQGGVPSIENSWTYICLQKAQQTLDNAKQIFNNEIANQLILPVSERDLEQCVEFFANKSRKEFQKLPLDEVDTQQNYIKQLDNHVQQRFEELKLANLNECRALATNTLTQLYTELNQRFMQDKSPQNISQNIKTLDYTLVEIQNLYDANVHDFSEKFLIFLNAKSSFLNDLVFFVHANMENHNLSQTQTLNDLQNRNNSSILEAKEALRIEKQVVENKLKEKTQAMAEVEAALDLLKEQYADMKTKKESDDAENDSKIRELKQAYQQKLEEQRDCKEDFDEKVQNLHRDNKKALSCFEKDKALMEQKISYLEKSLEEKTSKEKEYLSNWNSQKSELSSEIRQVCQKYESELKQSNLILEDEKERSSELEAQLNDLQAIYKEKTKKWQEQEQRYRDMIDRTQDHAKQIESAALALKNENVSGLEATLKEKTDLLDKITKKCQDLEEKLAQTDEEMKLKLNEANKNSAIKNQKLEFLEIQLKETRQQLDDVNKQHESMVEAMNANNSAVQESNPEPRESPSQIEKLYKNITDLKAKVQSFQEKAQELELKSSFDAKEAQRTQQELLSKIDDLEKQKLTLQAQIKTHNQEKQLAIEQLEANYSQEVKKLEQELEEKQANGEIHIKSIQNRSEESLAQLKAFFEAEKEKQEQRLREEREKAQKKVDQYQDEIESKMRDEFIEKDEELEMIRQNLQELEQRHSQQVTQSTHEISMKQQIIENLESQNNDQKKRIEMIESTRNQAFEKQLGFFEQQRLEYNERIEKLQKDNLDKEKQIAQLQHKLERIQDDWDRKDRDLNMNFENITKERDQLVEKNQNLKKKLSDSQDEVQQQQLVFGRDQALSQQSIEFLQSKIQEMQSSMDQRSLASDAKLQQIRQDLQEEYQGSMERIQNERDIWEKKYDQKRKALKEIEQQLNKDVAELEKKNCVLQENCKKLDQDKRTQEVEFAEKLQEYELQIQNLDQNADQAYQFGNIQTETVMQYKTTIQDLERALSDAQSNYDKEKALWEGRCQFLVNQKETYKKDLNESTKKFEITLEQLQKRGNTAQDRHELDQNALAKGIEQKYQTKIKEMLESHSCLQSEMHNKIKRLEDDNKNLSVNQNGAFKELEIEKSRLEKKYEDLIRSHEALQVDCEELKEDRERKLAEFQKQAQSEKEMYRARQSEVENKLNESNQRRNHMVFEIEKERARWQIKYDSIVANKRELEDIISNLERRRDLLFKENERLKAEVKVVQQSHLDKGKLGEGFGQSLLSPPGHGLYRTAISGKKGATIGSENQQMMGLKGIQNGLNGKFSTGLPSHSSQRGQNDKQNLQMQQILYQSNGATLNNQTLNNRYGDSNVGMNSASFDHSASFSHHSQASQDQKDVSDVMNMSQNQSTFQPLTQVPQPLPQPRREVPTQGARKKSGEARKNQASAIGIGSSQQFQKGRLKNQLTVVPQLVQSASQQQMQMRLSSTDHPNGQAATQKKTSTRYN